ncbi:hypothetical protein ElyMa_004436600 [Elysia marginata]|uniref:Uncharacterized protein n=1 Tax=Elysia marginata TaxID=1093978 RepID=A0AAV4HCV1_9GAST|nr:hypothetical protein ElyMa_004436600 [Elysia marginata]
MKVDYGVENGKMVKTKTLHRKSNDSYSDTNNIDDDDDDDGDDDDDDDGDGYVITRLEAWAKHGSCR